MDEIKRLAAVTALNQMMRDGHVCIVDIRKIAEMLGIPVGGDAYNILSTLHCVKFTQMPQELRDKIPTLIKEVLSMEPTYQFPMPKIERPVIEVETEPKRGTLLRLLGR